MSRVALAVALAAVFATGGIVAVVLASNGRSGGDARVTFGRLAWMGTPQVYRYPTIPNDRILHGRVRNASFKEVDLVARRDVKLIDAAGNKVDHAATFAAGYGRDIYPPRYLRAIPDADQVRLGLKAKVKPGASVPLTLTWRVRRGRPAPVRVELPGGGQLPLPVARR